MKRSHYSWILTSAVCIAAYSLFWNQTSVASGMQSKSSASKRPRSQGKVSRAFQIEIVSKLPVIAKAGDAISLEATVTANKEASQIDFVWSLPEGVQAVSPITGSLGAMRASETRTITFQGTSLTSENQQIHLHVHEETGRERVGATAQYNTRDEDAIAQKIRDRADQLERREQETGKRLRITQ